MRKTNKADRTSVKAVDTLRPSAGVRTTAVDCYRSGVSAPVYPEAGRRCACQPAEIVAEVAVAGEANGDRDLGDRLFGAEQQFLRSEEHTSELQSLMRISYAVFCLKKKKNIKNKTHNHYHDNTMSIINR